MVSFYGCHLGGNDSLILSKLESIIEETVSTKLASIIEEAVSTKTKLSSIIEETVSTKTKLASIEEAVGTKKIPKRGSDVTVADYNHTFQFTQAQYEYAPKLLCWNPKHMKQFENKAKEILLSKYVDEFISFANDPKRKEVKDIQPLLTELFSDLLPVAFPTRDFKQLKIGRIEYVDAQIIDANSQNIIIYNGFTDLSIVYQPLELSLGGSETKISKKNVVERNNPRNLNASGKKAVAQTGSQILGAVQKLKKFIVDVDPFSMIATNGWQWIFVQRKLGKDGSFFYYHLPAISFGEFSVLEKNAVNQDDDEEDNDDEETEPKKGVASQKRKVLKKPESDHCYGEICHLLALMFDNTEFFWQQLEVSEILNKIDMVSLNPRDESSSAEENESEDENVPNKGQSWSQGLILEFKRKVFNNVT